MLQGTREDEDDVFVDNLNTALFLFLGSLSVFASVILLVYSATAVVHSQQFLMSFFTYINLGSFLVLHRLRRIASLSKAENTKKKEKVGILWDIIKSLGARAKS